jgi:carbonic anhydrase
MWILDRPTDRPAPQDPALPPSRRHVLGTLAAAGAGMLAASLAPRDAFGRPPALHEHPHALAPIATPEDALRELLAGNQRFVEGRIMAPHRNMARLKEVAPKQTPFAAFLGCADSRVPIEIVFDQGFGDLFPVRVAGNVVTPEVTASLEFGTLVLGAKVLFVLGHSACGAVTATMKGDAVPGQISSLYQHIAPAADAANGDIDAAIAGNVRLQMRLLKRSPVVAQLEKEGKLVVVGGVYDLASGRVTMVDHRA